MANHDTESDSGAAGGWDIIGDVHGCAQTLERLLDRLGYSKRRGVYQHPERRAVFVGDIIDRGPRIREALTLVRDMVEADKADMVLGNHEINALAYFTPHPERPGQYIRPHTERNTRIIAETLEQFANYPEQWRDHLDWFTRLPLYREYPFFRVAHACWDAEAIARHEQAGNPSHLGQAGVMALADPQSAIARLTKRLTTGVEIDLPDDAAMLTAEGYLRYNFRARFWGERPQTYGDCVFQPDPIATEIAEKPLSEAQQQALVLYDSTEPILFIGHYWLTGTPQPIAPNIACLDYSAVKFGRLVAYRMDRESVVDYQKFVWVYVDP